MQAYKRLRARFACFCAVSTGCIVTVLVICTYIYSAKQIEYHAEKIFSSECNAILHSLEARGVISAELLNHMQANHDLSIELEPHQPNFATGPERNVIFMESEAGDFRVCAAKLKIGEGWVGATIVRDRSDEYAQSTRLLLANGVGILAIIALLAIASWFYSAWAIRPVAEAYRSQDEFLLTIAHELRTPLTVIQMNAENIPKATPENAGQFARTILRESKRMGRLTKDLLDLSNGMRNGWSMELSPQNPTYILLTAYESYELAAKEKGIALRVTTPDCQIPQIVCDASRIQQVLAVLIDNAMRHTPAGGQINLQVALQRKHIAFIVSDSGTGIPNRKRSLIFDKFYQGDTAGNAHKNHGLGLYIAMELMLLHHGELLVEDSRLGGAMFTARIPWNDSVPYK